MLVEITPKNRLSATKICPELITTRLGIYKKSPMQEFADKKFLTQPGMEKGFSIDNYQSWLNWTYEMLAETKYDDPLTGFARDLEERSDNRFNIIFLMSFSEKGFPSFRKNEKKNSNFKSFSVKLDNTRIDYEREFIRGRFGNPLIIERSQSLS